MASTKVKGIVIASKDYKERDKIVTLYTLEQGKVVCNLKGVKGEKAKLKSAKEIFCFGEYLIENTKGFNIVTQVEIIDNFFGLTQNLDKFYEGCAVLDITNKISSQESDPKFFIEVLKCLKTLCYDRVNKYYCINKFLLKMFEALGYSFVSNNCSSCHASLNGKKYFNLDIGEVVCAGCKNDTCINISESCFSALKIFRNFDYEKLSTIKIGGNGEVECFRLLEKNFEWRMGNRFTAIPNFDI